jgi:hypothetical protein
VPNRKKPANRQSTRRQRRFQLVEPVSTPADGSEITPLSPADLSAAFGAEPDPAGLVANLARSTIREVIATRTPLDAELVFCEVLGMLERSAPEEATPQDRQAVREALLTDLVEWAQREGGAGALALLRVIGALTGAPLRDRVHAAALRVASDGAIDRPWAREIGRPRALRAWRYGDRAGCQESVSVVFGYTPREHVLSALIDHDLGGGVKDCWVATQRDVTRIHERTRTMMSTNPATEFADITVSRAAALLQEALGMEPCPVQPDQLQDVARFLPLLRARMELADW